jgi:urease accessory protein
MLNTHIRRAIPAAFTLAALLAPSAALAHPGHDPGTTFMAGILHPLSGLDHVLMIVAISAWAAMFPAAGRLLVVGSLALFVTLGAAVPLAPPGTGLESALALTVIGSGVLLALGRRMPMWAAGMLAGGFALIHGFAHGTEGPAVSGLYIPGLAVATAGLALVVTFTAARMQQRVTVLRAAGCVGALGGIAALVG